MSERPIFFDPSGRRAVRFRWWFVTLGLLAAISTTIFGVSLFVSPLLRQIAPAKPRHTQPLPAASLAKRAAVARVSEITRAKLVRSIRAPAEPALRRADRIVAAYYAPWQETGIHSLRAHARQITHVMPAWLRFSADGMHIDDRDFDPAVTPHNADVVQIARQNGVRVLPILANSKEGEFQGDRVARLLASPAAMRMLASETREWIEGQAFAGIHLDLENLTDAEQRRLPELLEAFAAEFHPANLQVSAALESSLDADVLASCAEACDFVVVMAYDEHSSSTAPGPIASLPFVTRTLEIARRGVPENKLVLGFGAYAYDWNLKAKTSESCTFDEAMQRAKDNRDEDRPQDTIEFGNESLNPRFEYEDEQGQAHEVWFLDAITAANQISLARQAGLRGAAVWVLGAEDPSVWSVFDESALKTPPDWRKLETIFYPYQIDFEGEGEILDVRAQPTAGTRRLTYDPATQLIDDAEYGAYATPYLIKRWGQQPKKLVLTFDDGPDPRYTPEVLQVLKELDVPAAFFMIGQNVDHNAGLVRDMFADGFEIGNHSFTHVNMGKVDARRADLELNATQRVIQAATLHSTRLFRPPYNADAEPVSPEEVAPVELASKLGYLTIGELVDPQDWRLFSRNPDGTSHRRTAEEMAEIIRHDIAQHQGNMILLHDAGGDRTQTVKLLRIIVPEFRAKGYTFTTIADLAGMTRAQLMPPVGAKDLALVGVDRVVFTVWTALEGFLAIGFVVALVLGIARMAMVLPLAYLHRRRAARLAPMLTARPSVSALVAAYNEEKVIVRTVESILASDYPLAEVIVVDDGSQDGTAEAVRSRFGSDERVLVIQKANGGKASALNEALTHAQGEVIFCVDADTQLAPDAIGKLARHFGDPGIGAVAGNVRVGNAANILTQWQSIEYTTSQNLDRRAYAMLNAVTVVPGAIGAWRTSVVRELGGYSTDTLAEDMDLTWRIRRAGYRIETESEAYAYTEAPERFGSFFKQRFRWAYGTLQCLWKHRAALGRHGWFGRFALPTQWLFQVVFQALAPLVDLKLAAAALMALLVFLQPGSQEADALAAARTTLDQIAFYYGLFFVIEFVAGFLAYRMERQSPRALVWLLLQRFAYRQIMYGVIYKSIMRAITGARQGWGKLDRSGGVRVPS